MHLTVGIATWNRTALLAQTLEGLTRLRPVPGVTWDVVVCDNNSTDATRPTVESMTAKLPVRYLFEPTQGKSHALNRILRETDSPWLLFLDDDVKVDEGWLAAYARGIERYPKAGCLGGPILPWLDKPATGTAAFLLREYPGVFGVMQIDKDTPMSPPAISAWGANMALRRDAIPAGGFDAARGMIGGQRIAGEDVAIQDAIVKSGREGWLLADAVVRHYIPPDSLNAKRFWQWNEGYGRNRAVYRGKPTAGTLSVPWWAWRKFLSLRLRAAIRWRPRPTAAYFDALKDAAQYYGYLRAK